MGGANFDYSKGYRADMYETSIWILSIYFTRKYDNGDEIKIILNKLKKPTLENPKALDSGAYDM